MAAALVEAGVVVGCSCQPCVSGPITLRTWVSWLYDSDERSLLVLLRRRVLVPGLWTRAMDLITLLCAYRRKASQPL